MHTLLLWTMLSARAYVLEVSMNGVEAPVPFMADDNLTEVSWDWALRHPAAFGEGCQDAGCVAAKLELAMRDTMARTPLEGEMKGCAVGKRQPRPLRQLPGLVERAQEVAVNKRLIVTMISAGYADFGLSWASALDRIGETSYLLVALDEDAKFALRHLNVVSIANGSAVDDAGRLSAETFGTEAFRRVTSLKPTLMRILVIDGGLNVLYADADVTFLRPPWPYLRDDCPLSVQPVQMHTDLRRALSDWDTDPRNPRPRGHYFGNVVCSGLVYARVHEASKELLLDWEDRLLHDSDCGGDQAALEAITAAKIRDTSNVCALDLYAFPHGMALRALHIDDAILDGTADSVVAVHFNFLLGADNKRDWMSRLGLWYSK